MGVNTVLVQGGEGESFVQLVFDSFLSLTGYKRVMFLDCHTVPMINLDFYSHLSDPDRHDVPTLLKLNFIRERSDAHCNRDMFMVAPPKQNFEQHGDFVGRWQNISNEPRYSHLTGTKGGDKADGFRESQKVSSHSSCFDNGLDNLYSKYMLRNISIAVGNRVQNWREGSGDLPVKESDVRDLLVSFQGYIC